MIIFLNGPSSSGKSSIAKALQELFDEIPFVHTGIDRFFKMMPSNFVHFQKHAEKGFKFALIGAGENSFVEIKNGPFGDLFYKSMIQSTRIMAQNCENIIVDEVLLEPKYLEWYKEELKDFKVYFIGVFCDLKILNEREYFRGNRIRGLAKTQAELVHFAKKNYDLSVDTSNALVFDIAQKIIDFIQENSDPKGFNKSV